MHPLSKTRMADLRGVFNLNGAKAVRRCPYTWHACICVRGEHSHVPGRDECASKTEDQSVSFAPARLRERLETSN